MTSRVNVVVPPRPFRDAFLNTFAVVLESVTVVIISTAQLLETQDNAEGTEPGGAGLGGVLTSITTLFSILLIVFCFMAIALRTYFEVGRRAPSPAGDAGLRFPEAATKKTAVVLHVTFALTESLIVRKTTLRLRSKSSCQRNLILVR